MRRGYLINAVLSLMLAFDMPLSDLQRGLLGFSGALMLVLFLRCLPPLVDRALCALGFD